jgi:hypothetical protein
MYTCRSGTPYQHFLVDHIAADMGLQRGSTHRNRDARGDAKGDAKGDARGDRHPRGTAEGEGDERVGGDVLLDVGSGTGNFSKFLWDETTLRHPVMGLEPFLTPLTQSAEDQRKYIHIEPQMTAEAFFQGLLGHITGSGGAPGGMPFLGGDDASSHGASHGALHGDADMDSHHPCHPSMQTEDEDAGAAFGRLNQRFYNKILLKEVVHHFPEFEVMSKDIVNYFQAYLNAPTGPDGKGVHGKHKHSEAGSRGDRRGDCSDARKGDRRGDCMVLIVTRMRECDHYPFFPKVCLRIHMYV